MGVNYLSRASERCSFIFRRLNILVLAIVLSACETVSVYENSPDQSLIKRYESMTLVEASDGTEVLRTVNPKIQKYSFEKMILDPVVMRPKPVQSSVVSVETLDEITAYLDEQLRTELAKNHQLVSEPGNNIPKMKVVLTGVKLETEGMRVTEILPYGAVIGLIRKATDTRNKEVTVLVEVEVVDSKTGEMLAAIVRAGEGDDVRMLWSPELTLEHVQELLDSWVELAAAQLGEFSARK